MTVVNNFNNNNLFYNAYIKNKHHIIQHTVFN